MGKATPEDFFRSVKSGKSVSVYLLYGEDSLNIDRGLKALEKSVIGSDLPEFNTDYFHGKEADPGEVIGAARTLPVMADKRLVVLRRVEEWKTPDREQILEYLKSPCPTTVFCLVAYALSLKGKSAKKEDWALVSAAAKSGVAVNFARPQRGRLGGVISAMVRERGKRIEAGAVRLLAELAGDEMLGLEHEIAKIILFIGDRNDITRNDVLEAVADVKEANVFEFTDAIGARDVENALRALQRMREQGQQPLMVLSMLTRHFRLIWKIQEYMDRGEPPGKTAKLTGLNEWVLKKSYLPQVSKFKESDTGKITAMLAELDIRMKSTGADKDILFERTIIKLCLGHLF